MDSRYSAEFVAWITALPMSKRAAQARDHLLEYGSLTTEQLSAMGYVHPPRAIGDLKDAGATIKRASVRSSDGKLIGQYTLIEEITTGKAGRINIPKAFREELNRRHGFQCAICNGRFEGRELQADHRVPFIVGGDRAKLDIADYMPLCASDNRSKSWSCEHCANLELKHVDVCESCFWAHPEDYSHVAMRQERRFVVVFQGDEAYGADEFIKEVKRRGEEIDARIKHLMLKDGRRDET